MSDLSSLDPDRPAHAPVEAVVPAEPWAVATARHHVRRVMRGWGESDERCETTALLVTELVTNAVRHAVSRSVAYRLSRTADGVRVEVSDAADRSAAVPGQRRAASGLCAPVSEPQVMEEHGRGLWLVDSLVTRWGATDGGGGCHMVWAEV